MPGAVGPAATSRARPSSRARRPSRRRRPRRCRRTATARAPRARRGSASRRSGSGAADGGSVDVRHGRGACAGARRRRDVGSTPATRSASSRSSTRAWRKAASALGALDERIELGARARQLLRRLDPARPEPVGAGAAARRGALRRMSSFDHLPTRRGRAGVSSVTVSSSLRRWPRQREIRLAIVPGGMRERVADRSVALVAGEEPVEDLLALRRRAGRGPSRTVIASSSCAITSSVACSSSSSTGTTRPTSAGGRGSSCASAGRSRAGSHRPSGASRAARRPA